MEWMLAPYRRYFDFSGRSRRMEYWMFQLFMLFGLFGFLLLSGAIGAMIEAALGPGSLLETILGGIYGLAITLFMLGSVIPGLAVAVRRLHDTGKSGWLLLIGLIPFGGIVLLVFMFLEGDRGDNTYGPDPKMPQNSADIFS